MSLAKVLEEINSIRPILEEDTDSGPAETLSGRRGRQRQAVEQMKRLKELYVQNLLRSSVFILVTGASRQEFTDTASQKFGCFSADPEGFYRDLASRIPNSLYVGKESAASLFDIVGRHLEDKAGELGVIGYPQLIFKASYSRAINSQEDFVGLLKTAINEQVGGEFVGLHTVRSLADSAIETGHSAPVTPIVLGTDDTKLAMDLVQALDRLTPRVFLVVAGKASKKLMSADGAVVLKNVNEETVEQALTEIRSKLKK
jgi:hypothetical protein